MVKIHTQRQMSPIVFFWIETDVSNLMILILLREFSFFLLIG